jgi:hypothetical protein
VQFGGRLRRKAGGGRSRQCLRWRSDCRIAVGGSRRDFSNKPVSAFGNRFDEPLALDALAEDPPQRRDVLRQIVFLDERIGPDQLQQVFFRDQATLARHQRQERVDGFGSQRNRLVVAQQDFVDRIEAKRPEYIARPRRNHNSAGFQNDFKILSELSNDPPQPQGESYHS